MTRTITLESLHVAQDQKRKPFYVPVYAPGVPYYLYRAVEDLEKWADALDRIDPYELGDDHEEIREHLDDAEPQEVAKVLRRLAESEEARRLILFRGKGGRGPTPKRADRDYLLAFEYCLRQRLSKSIAGRGREKMDVAATALRWRDWRVTDAGVRKARTEHGKKCREEIEFQIVKWMEPPHLCPLDHVLAALFRGVCLAQHKVSRE